MSGRSSTSNDPAETRLWIATALGSLSANSSRAGKKRLNVDTL